MVQNLLELDPKYSHLRNITMTYEEIYINQFTLDYKFHENSLIVAQKIHTWANEMEIPESEYIQNCFNLHHGKLAESGFAFFNSKWHHYKYAQNALDIKWKGSINRQPVYEILRAQLVPIMAKLIPYQDMEVIYLLFEKAISPEGFIYLCLLENKKTDDVTEFLKFKNAELRLAAKKIFFWNKHKILPIKKETVFRYSRWKDWIKNLEEA